MENNFTKIKIVIMITSLLVSFVGVLFSLQTIKSEGNLTISSSYNVGPTEKIRVNLNEKLLFRDAAEIHIEPMVEFKYQWLDDNTLEILPTKNWNLNEKFKVEISNVKDIFFRNIKGDFYFVTDDYPRVKKIFPENGQKDVQLDIEEPILIQFDKSIKNYNIKFVISPLQELSSQIEENYQEVRLLPNAELDKGKEIKIKIYIKYSKEKNDNFKQIYESSFLTKPEEIKVLSQNLNEKLNQAKILTTAQIKTGKYIDVSLKNQVMVIFENGVALDAYLISSGKRGFDTPMGTHKIINKHPRAWSGKYKLFMPFWMAITPDGKYGIHELPEWPGGYKEGANHLGTPVSHGCVRLGTGAANRVYDWAEIGMPVIVH